MSPLSAARLICLYNIIQQCLLCKWRCQMVHRFYICQYQCFPIPVYKAYFDIQQEAWVKSPYHSEQAIRTCLLRHEPACWSYCIYVYCRWDIWVYLTTQYRLGSYQRQMISWHQGWVCIQCIDIYYHRNYSRSWFELALDPLGAYCTYSLPCQLNTIHIDFHYCQPNAFECHWIRLIHFQLLRLW